MATLRMMAMRRAFVSRRSSISCNIIRCRFFSDQAAETPDVVTIDRSDMYAGELYQSPKIPESDLVRQLKSLIMFRGGPITVAEYMDLVLTSPAAGYYLHQEVFGASGSFTTAPEVSQMFGEMVGVWCVSLWEQMGKPSKLQLVELGPGRGTLMQDLLRSTNIFKEFTNALSIHLVECSPAMRKMQRKALDCNPESDDDENEKKNNEGKQAIVEQGKSQRFGTDVSWYLDLMEVPRGVPTIIIAQEFFDALPVHQFQKTPVGWCEKLVNVDPSGKFEFVLSSSPTAAAKLYLRKRLDWITAKEESMIEHIEVCPKALGLSKEIAKRVSEDSGGGIIIDYGKDELITDSLQAIRNHKFVNVLDRPGTADLSAHVDFAAIKKMVVETKCGAKAYGPISQQEFLVSLGINHRLEALVKPASEEEGQKLQLGYWRIVGEGHPPWLTPQDEGYTIEGMGKQYKALAIADSKLGAPVCFQ